VLHETFGIDRGLLTTVHAYTNSQKTVDTAEQNGQAGARRAPAATATATRAVTRRDCDARLEPGAVGPEG
ncbi:MAG: hypothetical protein ACKOTB_09290, partial [Planctomycetia bacterium]